MSDNPFTEAEIDALAIQYSPYDHALARLKDHQCMDTLREDNAKLEAANEAAITALTGLYRIYCEIDGREDVIQHLEECKAARAVMWEDAVNALAGNSIDTEMTCRVCGCTHFTPCDPPCAWAEPGLCTACKDKAI